MDLPIAFALVSPIISLIVFIAIVKCNKSQESHKDNQRTKIQIVRVVEATTDESKKVSTKETTSIHVTIADSEMSTSRYTHFENGVGSQKVISPIIIDSKLNVKKTGEAAPLIDMIYTDVSSQTTLNQVTSNSSSNHHQYSNCTQQNVLSKFCDTFLRITDHADYTTLAGETHASASLA